MNDRQKTWLAFFKEKKSASRLEIERFAADAVPTVSRATLLRDLASLAADGKISKTGTGRAVRYVYSVSPILETFDMDRYFAHDPDERELVSESFNFDIWEHLKNLLTAREKPQLAALNQAYRERIATLSPALLKKEFERITIELSWKSSKIEGNTYTLLDTEMLIKENIEASGKTKDEARMVLNHKRAMDYIFSEPGYFKKVSVRKLEDLHRLLVEGLGVAHGIRGRRVGITSTRYRPLDNPHQIREALERLCAVLNAAAEPLEKAMVAVLMISYLQPFEDGNKRAARILGNALLLAHGWCPLSYRSVDELAYKKAVLLFYERNSAHAFKKLFLEQFTYAVENYF